MLVPFALCAVACLVAQATQPPVLPAPPPAQEDAASLATALDAAHCGPAAPGRIESFQAQIQIQPRQKDGEAVSVDLDVEFQMPKALRAVVRENGLRIERGNDPKTSAWVRKDDEVTALQGPEWNQEADKVLNEVRLCRQVLGFLDPKSLIARMETPSAVRREDLAIFRLRYPACRVVEGTVANFPTYTLGTEGRTRVTVWVHGETNRLLAVSALPLDEKDKPRELAELVVLDALAPVQDVLLPASLNVYRLAGPGKELLLTVRIKGIELASKFAPDHFRRPR